MPLLKNPPECTDDVGLLGEIHGQIRVFPVTQHTETFEIGALLVHLGHGVITAGLTELTGTHLVTRLANLFLDLQFDRQSMAIPARHIGCVKSGQGTALDDDVLEHLVHRMADMDLAVGVGRPVMQDELLPPGADLADLLIQTFGLPAFQHLRLAIGQIGLHRKRGLGKVQRVLVIVAHGLRLGKK